MKLHDFTLLVVDDNDENRDMLSRRLERKGFAVRTVAGGQEALDLIARERVDLVLLDIMMPGMNGLEVLKVLRLTHSPAELPIVMQTAKSESEDVIEALELGANDYVTKPLDFPVVFARVQAQLRIKRADRPPEKPLSPGLIEPGMVLAERYRLESPIGSGSFGTVFKGRHLELDRPVAVKVLQQSVAANPDALERFRREGISACRVKHPNAVAVLDFGVLPGGVAYLVMELLEGHSLFAELESQGVLTPQRTADVIIPVCSVLAEAHAAGVVHRDIKPSNIFLQRTIRGEVPKVLDFGIAKIAGDAAGQDLTMAGAVLGTLAYMSPERFSTRPADGKSDVYSLGVTLYQMLAGRLPFVTDSDDPMVMVMMHVNEPPPALGIFNRSLPEPVEAAVMQTLRKRPEERPTAEELARNLGRAMGVAMPEASEISVGPATSVDVATRVASGLPLPTLAPELPTREGPLPSADETSAAPKTPDPSTKS